MGRKGEKGSQGQPGHKGAPGLPGFRGETGVAGNPGMFCFGEGLNADILLEENFSVSYARRLWGGTFTFSCHKPQAAPLLSAHPG